MTRCVALLRGINVGGHARVAMADLQAMFVALGFEDAKTFIQSGNVVFSCADGPPAGLGAKLEKRLASDLGVPARVILRTAEDLAEIVAGNPFAKRKADPSRFAVTFLAERPDAKRAASLVVPPGEDAELRLAGREVYLHIPQGFARTKLTNAYIESRLEVAATARNWHTVLKLLNLASSSQGPRPARDPGAGWRRTEVPSRAPPASRRPEPRPRAAGPAGVARRSAPASASPPSRG